MTLPERFLHDDPREWLVLELRFAANDLGLKDRL